jgi:hypothetical protein
MPEANKSSITDGFKHSKQSLNMDKTGAMRKV